VGLDLLHDGRENVLVEEDHAVEIEFWAEQVEENVLTVAFVRF